MQKKKKKKKKKIYLLPKEIRINAEKIQNSVEKIQKITNRVDWILSKRICDVIIMFIALTKILEREGSISYSSFYGQLPDYQSHVSAFIHPVGEFSVKEMKTWDQSKISSYCFVFGMNQEN